MHHVTYSTGGKAGWGRYIEMRAAARPSPTPPQATAAVVQPILSPPSSPPSAAAAAAPKSPLSGRAKRLFSDVAPDSPPRWTPPTGPCPPTPYRHTGSVRKSLGEMTSASVLAATAEQLNAKPYIDQGIPLGKKIGEGTYSIVYKDASNPHQVIKIPHYKGLTKGAQILQQTFALRTQILKCPKFKETKLWLPNVTLHQTEGTGLPYLTQEHFHQHFDVKTDLALPEVREQLKELFRLCSCGDLPALDLAPSNLFWRNGRLGLFDWLIDDDHISGAPGALFNVHMPSKLEEFGPVYKHELDPRSKQRRVELSSPPVPAAPPSTPELDFTPPQQRQSSAPPDFPSLFGFSTSLSRRSSVPPPAVPLPDRTAFD